MPTLNFGPCARRSTALEPIEHLDLPTEDLFRALSFVEMVSHWTGGNELVINFLDDCVSRMQSPVSLSLLEVGCLRGELAHAIVDWARLKKIDIRILAIDDNPRFIDMARERSLGYKEITFDVRSLHDPVFLQAQQFDYTISVHLLHRERTPEATFLLKKMNFLSKRGLMACDWVRDLRAYLWMAAFSSFVRNESIRSGARLSIRKGYTLNEVRRMAKEAGVDYLPLTVNFGYRFTLAGERGLLFQPKLVAVPGLAV
jgi:hypothetical protein